MRAQEGTAKRYAKALYLLAREGGAPAEAGQELERVVEIYRSQPEVREVLARPWVKPIDRRRIAGELAQKTGCGKRIQDFVGLLAERGRMDHLPQVGVAYRALLDEAEGLARARVRTVVALTAEQKRELGARLERAVGKRVVVEEEVNGNLLGGFIAQVGSYILDASLDGHLVRMRERLARG